MASLRKHQAGASGPSLSPLTAEQPCCLLSSILGGQRIVGSKRRLRREKQQLRDLRGTRHLAAQAPGGIV